MNLSVTTGLLLHYI